MTTTLSISPQKTTLTATQRNPTVISSSKIIAIGALALTSLLVSTQRASADEAGKTSITIEKGKDGHGCKITIEGKITIDAEKLSGLINCGTSETVAKPHLHKPKIVAPAQTNAPPLPPNAMYPPPSTAYPQPYSPPAVTYSQPAYQPYVLNACDPANLGIVTHGPQPLLEVPPGGCPNGYYPLINGFVSVQWRGHTYYTRIGNVSHRR